jgi:hypothetical protein
VLDEIRGAEIADQLARCDGVAKVERDGDRDHPDSGDLESVRRPPGAAHHREVQQSELSGGQPNDSFDDDEVR